MKQHLLKMIVTLFTLMITSLGSQSALAEVSAGGTGSIGFDGTACASAPGGAQYASTTLTFGTPAKINNLLLRDDDVITQNLSVSLTDAFSELPDMCDGIRLFLKLHVRFETYLGDDMYLSHWFSRSDEYQYFTIGQLKSQGTIKITLHSRFNDSSYNKKDLARGINYSVPVKFSLIALPN